MRLRGLGALVAVAIGLQSCSQKERVHGDARQLSQCMDVCKACMNGNTVTCSTSCRLKGATLALIV
jgi:hypothetical protein